MADPDKQTPKATKPPVVRSPRQSSVSATPRTSSVPPPSTTTPIAAAVNDDVRALKACVDRNHQETMRMFKDVNDRADNDRAHNNSTAAAIAKVQETLDALVTMRISPANVPPTTSSNGPSTSRTEEWTRNVTAASIDAPAPLTLSPLPPHELPAGAGRASSGLSGVSRQSAAHKLHDLPTFSGAPEDWPKFHAIYTQSSEAFGYTSLDNSIRLQRCLAGEAKEAVEFLLLDMNAASDIIDALEFRFGRPELLAQAQLRRVREIQPIAENKAEQILPFASKVANMVAYLNRPRTRQYLANPELLEQLVQKLPPSRQHDWGRHAVDIEPFATVQHFSTWLKDLARCVSYMTPAATLATIAQPTSNNRSKPVDAKPNRIMLTSNVDEIHCAVCAKDGHQTADCRKFARLPVPERWNVVRNHHLCFGCLRAGHSTGQCQDRGRCDVDGCNRPHHQLLHQVSARRNPFGSRPLAPVAPAAVQPPPANENADGISRDRVNNCHSAQEARIVFRIVPVKLFGPNRTVQTYALLDEGSSVTLLDELLADELGLTGPATTLDLQWFTNRHASEASRSVALRISGTGSGHQQFELTNVRTIRRLDLPTQSVCMTEMQNCESALRGVPIQDYRNAVPKILIGLDHIHLGVATEHISDSSPGLVATNTRLGWVVCGCLPAPSAQQMAPVLHIRNSICADLNDLHKAVNDYFSLESFGVRHCEQPLESRDDKRARFILKHTTTRINERYETGLLWRSDTVNLPDSKAMATNRLMSVERKMKRDAVFAARYSAIIDDYVAKGFARCLSTVEAANVNSRTWYLPHFAVFNPNKPDKMRVVFDAAAEVHGTSLNSVLMKGPDLNRPLVAVLHRFRMGAVGVCADIKEMFLQVRIRQTDVNSQRFLWRGGDATKTPDVYIMQSMIFGAACSPCSAQYVKNTNADEHITEHPEAANIIRDGHYVDDFVVSFDTADEASRITKEVVDIHRQGGFELRGFVSNSAEVLRKLGGNETSASSVDMEMDANKAEKILGMYWCTSEDAFCFRLTFNRVDPAVVDGSRSPTKRELLSATMSVYDPFGILANFTIYAKLLLQDLWRLGTGWDEPISEELQSKWSQWVAKLDCCRQVRVPRCYEPGINIKCVQLHIFADASKSAYAAVAYWRIEIAPGVWRLAFVMGKSRCAPPKLLSIPRLELQAAVLAVRMCSSIRAIHDIAIERTFYWSDSKTVVLWIRSDHMQFKPFVAHRLSEILEISTVEQWHWVPTLLNAADDATRAKYPVRYAADNRWINGPDFLLLPESQWPAEPAQMHCDEGTEEVQPRSVHLVCTTSKIPVVQVTCFSDFHRACRSMAVMLRFIKCTRTKTKADGELQPSEIEAAAYHLIRAAQQEKFGDELAMLRNGRQVAKSSSIRNLLPHIDQHGVLRMTGRVDKAIHLPVDARNPIILPKDHHLTTILVAQYHRRLRHQQQSAVVNEIRLKYWVPHLRAVVRRVKSACMLCRLRAAQPTEPVMGQLPTDRVTPFVRPFTYTGIDYFGPMLVTIGRRREKRWVALFTCLTVRAVHLELATDLSTDACILCLRNFMNVRGVPKRIRSDNGTNFVGASRELREAIDMLDHAAIQRELSTNNVEWLFNCPANPQAGGCWERLVQSVKRVLSVTVKEVAPRVETLRSFLLEAANIVNTRPLTHLPVSGDEDEPLTPNHFLLGAANSTQTPSPDDSNVMCLRKQWHVAQALKNRFWKRWILEYLPELTRRAKGFEEQPPLLVGSLVLICDPLLPRGQWRRGRIKQVFAGQDGRVRTALVSTSQGELRRPVTKLAVLDIEE